MSEPRLKPNLVAALRALDRVGAPAYIEFAGRILVAGEYLPFGAVTYLRLLTRGLVEGAGPDRIQISLAGRHFLEPKR